MKNPKAKLIFAIACVALIVFSALIGSLVQTAGWTASITDLRDVTNTGTKIMKSNEEGAVEKAYAVNGSVTSGILIVPKNATKDTPAPAVVLTHGMYNNREMQYQFGIELARRGFVTLMVDRPKHGHNDGSTLNSGDDVLNGAKYLYNLTDKEGNRIVDPDRIGTTGHSFAGMAIANALGMDGYDTKGKCNVAAGESYTWNGATEEALSKGYHMAILSAAVNQACTPNNANYGSNMLGVGNIMGNADDLYDKCNTKTPVYSAIPLDKVTTVDYANALKGQYKTNSDGYLYVKKGNNFVKVTEKIPYSKLTTYYRLSTVASCKHYLQSDMAMTYIGVDTKTFTGAQYNVVNGGVYDKNAGGVLINQPSSTKYVSQATKGQQLSSNSKSIRMLYETDAIHTMITFSTITAAQCSDFFYCVFGTPQGARFINPVNQTWWIKEGIAIVGVIAMFGLLLAIIDFALTTRPFKSLAAAEGEVEINASLGRSVRKHISYWVVGALTMIFGIWCYCEKLDGWYATSLWKELIENTTNIVTGIPFRSWTTVSRLCYWGVCSAIFAMCLTAVVWVINRIINMVKYKEDYEQYDDHPFQGFKVRNAGNIFKTILLAAILLAVFYGIVNLLWKVLVVDFRFFTFGFRIFKLDRLPSYLRFGVFFFIYYLVAGALSQNYRVKDLPEWATIAINVGFNVVGIMLFVCWANAYSIATGTVNSSLYFRNYCYTYPLIPAVGIATVMARRIYVKTGNAWLAALTNALIFTCMSCANQSVGI